MCIQDARSARAVLKAQCKRSPVQAVLGSSTDSRVCLRAFAQACLSALRLNCVLRGCPGCSSLGHRRLLQFWTLFGENLPDNPSWDKPSRQPCQATPRVTSLVKLEHMLTQAREGDACQLREMCLEVFSEFCRLSDAQTKRHLGSLGKPIPKRRSM